MIWIFLCWIGFGFGMVLFFGDWRLVGVVECKIQIELVQKYRNYFSESPPNPMKQKKQKPTQPNIPTKKQQKEPLIPQLGKQFQLLYRTCDKLPSSQQYESVFFLKRKKITADQHPSAHDKKSKKKKNHGRKKKIQEEFYVDDGEDGFGGKGHSLLGTKSTMPCSTMGVFKKSTFADTFKEKIDLDRSSIKKVNNLSNSNSSRYLASKYIHKQQKPQKKKLLSPTLKPSLKSPPKQIPPSPIPTNPNPNTNQCSNKTLDQTNNTKSTKTIKQSKQKQKQRKAVINSKKIEKEQNRNIKRKGLGKRVQSQVGDKEEEKEYVFIDGEYVQVGNSQNQALTQKIISIYRSKAENRDNDRNEFIEGFSKVKRNLQKKSSIQNKQPIQLIPSQQQISCSQKSLAQQQILDKIILIQRWWRSCLSQRAIDQCNNIKHFPSNVQSQKQLSDRHSSQYEQEGEDQEEEMKISDGESNMVAFLEMREKLIFSHMQSQKEILAKMLDLRKIDNLKYASSLMEIESNFQHQMLQIKKFRQKVVVQAERMEQLKMKLKQKSQIINKLQKLPANVILQHFIDPPIKPLTSPQSTPPAPHQVYKNQPFNRQKSTGYHYSQLSQNAEDNKHSIYGKNTIKICENGDIKSPLNVVERRDGEKEQFVNSDQEEDGEGEEGDGNDQREDKEESCDSDCSKIEAIIEGNIDRQLAQAEIQKRYASQLGVGFQYSGLNKNGIPTSVISIHNFLMNFLKFYEYFYKDEFLKLINLPFGLNQRSRIKLHQNYTEQTWKLTPKSQPEDEETFFKIDAIIGDEILEDFHEHNYQLSEDIDDDTRAMLYFERIHQKAVVDCFNQCLNCFRPYYFINGAPYIWNYSQKALTFYYIAQQNIQQVFEKTQYKVLKTASSLCGVIAQPLISVPDIKSEMSLSQKLIKYRESTDPLLVENREEKLGKVQKVEIQEYNFKWEYFQEEKTCIRFDVAQMIYEELLHQLLEIKPLGNKVQTNQYISFTESESTQQMGSNSQSNQQSSSSYSSNSINPCPEPSQNTIKSNKNTNSSKQDEEQDQEEEEDQQQQQQQEQQAEQQEQEQGQQEEQEQEGEEQEYQNGQEEGDEEGQEENDQRSF